MRPDKLKTQYIAAIVHLALFSMIVLQAINTPPDALSQLVWFLLFIPDLPATALIFLTFAVVPREFLYSTDDFFSSIFSKHPYDSFSNFWFPFLIYGIGGTVWWFYVPRLIIWLKKRLWNGRKNNGEP